MLSQSNARIFVVGANHRSSTALLRDRLFMEESLLPQMFGRLRAGGLDQALILSTCDRTEIQGIHTSPETAADLVRNHFAAIGNVGYEEIIDQSYALYDEAALRHVFAVASSLDSQVVGEPQVLGQVKAGHRLAAECGMMGPQLDRVMQSAYHTAKRVRSETEIVRRPVSIASAAAQICQDLHGDLTGRTGLIVGLGEIGELIHEQLRTAGLQRVALTAASSRTETVARRAGIHFVPFDALGDALAEADIVVSAVGAGRHIIGRQDAEEALKRRRRRPILFLDGGVPPDIAPEVEECDGAFRYSLDDLEQVALQGRSDRQTASTAAWQIVDDEVGSWYEGRAGRDASPVIVELRERFGTVREKLLLDHPGIDAARATELLINRLLDHPSRALRGMARQPESDSAELKRLEEMIRRLFDEPSDRQD
jgi:glutamyl-tRNA reductase